MKAKPVMPTTESLRKQIEARAYVLWERAGRPHGRHEEHWNQAEKEVLSEAKAPARKKVKAAPPAPPKKPSAPPKKRDKPKKK
jgi:lysozyme family protein